MINEQTQTSDEPTTVAVEEPKLVISVRQLDRLETTAYRTGDGPF
jgi:hypothetical protein